MQCYFSRLCPNSPRISGGSSPSTRSSIASPPRPPPVSRRSSSLRPTSIPPRRSCERLARHELRCILFNLPLGDKSKGDFGIACRPGREAEFREGVARGIAYAKALDCRQVNCIAGRILDGDDRADLEARLVSNLRFAAREFQAVRIELVVEPLNDRDNPDFLVPRSPQMARDHQEVGEPNVGLQYDIYHTVMMGDDPAATLEALRPIIRTCSSPMRRDAANPAPAGSTCHPSSLSSTASDTTAGCPPSTAPPCDRRERSTGCSSPCGPARAFPSRTFP
jgi:hypothetical protein